MRDQAQDENGTDISRRTFVKASGVAAGAAALGVGATGSAAADEQLDSVFRNIRVREASKAWERGYRGRPDRSLALTDSGAEGRHPDLGPWNGVTAHTTEEGLELYDTVVETKEVPVYPTDVRGTESYTGYAAGAEVLGLRPMTHGPFAVPVDAFDGGTGDDEVRISTVITWTPENPEGVEPAEFELRLMKNGNQLATTGFQSATAQQPQEARKELVVNDGVELNADDSYEFWVYGYRAPAEYQIEAEIEEIQTDREPEGYETRTVAAEEPLDADGLAAKLPGADGAPQLIAWHNDAAGNGEFAAPRDSNGHGTHVSGIMTGTGRASAVDDATTDDPHAVLIGGDVLSYEVEAQAGGGVFGAATGEGIEVVIAGPDGRQLARSVGAQGTKEVSLEANITQTPTVHESGTAPYTVTVRTAQGEAVTVGRAKRVAAGSFLPTDQTGDFHAEDSLHAGVAPGYSLTAVTGLSGGSNNVARAADEFAEKLGVRAVNMSWGYQGGLPLGIAGGVVDAVPGHVESITDGGILTVAAAGNAATPANGNGSPAVAEEAVSVVATGPRDGIASYSSGGIGGLDEDATFHGKPDVTAPGGVLTHLDWAAKNGDPGSDAEYGDVRDFTGKGGTSMASPSVCGMAGLLAQAMEEDAPDALALPAPAETTREDVLRLKSVLLATASTTAFTAAPYHRAKAPVYTHGERDPYEGYGRANVDAAIDAVTRELLDGTGLADGETADASFDETVGLDVPDDARAVAGYVRTRGGTLDVSVDFSHYAGGNRGMTKGAPHLDLYVYDAEPAEHGEPAIVASAQGDQGSASVSVDVAAAEWESDDPTEETYLVVAELVNAPGVVNGFDVQTHFDLDLSFTAADVPVRPKPGISGTGTWNDDGDVYTAGQTNSIDITVDGVTADVTEDTQQTTLDPSTRVRVTDSCPWDIDETYSDGTKDGDTVDFGTFTVEELRSGVDLRYFAEAPGSTGRYTFGPVTLDLEDQVDDFAEATATFGGTDTNTVVGASSETDL